MKKLVIFDLDGTLLNTITDLGNACNYALKTMGFQEHAISTYNNMVGNGVRKLIERAEPDATPEQIEQLLAIFKEYYDLHNAEFSTPYPGIPELLQELTDSGVALAVASNKYQQAVEKIITEFFPEIPFVAIMGQTENRPVKPDPSIVFAILNQHPTAKADVLYVGDSGVDMETARRACIESAGVTWGFRPVYELRSHNADHIINSTKEILDIVKNSKTPFSNFITDAGNIK